MKHCPRCERELPISDFWRMKRNRDGLQTYCKDCLRAAFRAQDHERFLEIKRAYYRRNRERVRRSQKRYEQANREIIRAHVNLNAAVRRGQIGRGPCSICGSLPAEAHHPDYHKQFDIVWLCPKHHKEAHVRMRKAVVA